MRIIIIFFIGLLVIQPALAQPPSNKERTTIKTIPSPGDPVTIHRQLPKTESVKITNTFYDFSHIQMCIDKEITGILTTRPPAVPAPALPKIKPNGELEEVTSIKQNLTGLTDLMWSPGDVITVGFLPYRNKTLEVDLIKKYAKEWEGIANIKFQFVDDLAQAKVKIGFDDSLSYSWSWLGRYILNNPWGIATMLFGWRSAPASNPMNEPGIRANILHEFGHTLGFVHEHQSPAAGILWDINKVYALYTAPPLNWLRSTVDDQIFKKYSNTITNSSTYDKFSIMHYFFPNSLTVNKTSFPINMKFSATDSAFARYIYPFAPTPSNASGILHTTDDCDEIVFTVTYNAAGVGDHEIDFILEPGINHHGNWVTWWKRIGIPLKGGVEEGLEIESRTVSNKKLPISLIDQARGISFSKAKFLGIHTLLNYKWNVLPALTGGCRVRLTWKRDTCL